jgi:hypothetical protein
MGKEIRLILLTLFLCVLVIDCFSEDHADCYHWAILHSLNKQLQLIDTKPPYRQAGQ